MIPSKIPARDSSPPLGSLTPSPDSRGAPLNTPPPFGQASVVPRSNPEENHILPPNIGACSVPGAATSGPGPVLFSATAPTTVMLPVGLHGAFQSLLHQSQQDIDGLTPTVLPTQASRPPAADLAGYVPGATGAQVPASSFRQIGGFVQQLRNNLSERAQPAQLATVRAVLESLATYAQEHLRQPDMARHIRGRDENDLQSMRELAAGLDRLSAHLALRETGRTTAQARDAEVVQRPAPIHQTATSTPPWAAYQSFSERLLLEPDGARVLSEIERHARQSGDVAIADRARATDPDDASALAGLSRELEFQSLRRGTNAIPQAAVPPTQAAPTGRAAPRTQGPATPADRRNFIRDKLLKNPQLDEAALIRQLQQAHGIAHLTGYKDYQLTKNQLAFGATPMLRKRMEAALRDAISPDAARAMLSRPPNEGKFSTAALTGWFAGLRVFHNCGRVLRSDVSFFRQVAHYLPLNEQGACAWFAATQSARVAELPGDALNRFRQVRSAAAGGSDAASARQQLLRDLGNAQGHPPTQAANSYLALASAAVHPELGRADLKLVKEALKMFETKAPTAAEINAQVRRIGDSFALAPPPT